eukprot:CAMPEP_0182554258 /NCGR_PEP_ID=MMETSP1323-20130603/49895_1 /TAXON_ID=236787 /ORGANISM="Florenciella parvula, Strain RCC1693" /LENGTH=121 /DNA_ID=CAMNT_0024765981 /DNA_START=609 /DNA_END=971 /DNA_ORIENTATION=+
MSVRQTISRPPGLEPGATVAAAAAAVAAAAAAAGGCRRRPSVDPYVLPVVGAFTSAGVWNLAPARRASRAAKHSRWLAAPAFERLPQRRFRLFFLPVAAAVSTVSSPVSSPSSSSFSSRPA